MAHEWYRIQNLTAGGADVFIYDEIGSEGIGATAFVKDLDDVKGPINLHLNSPGGEVYDGIAIYNALKDRKGVTVYVDALAASISSVIAMAGDKVVMGKHSAMMIHDAMGATVGNAAEVQKMVNLLDRTSEEIASIYQERAGGETSDWRDLMKAETWYNAQEAVDAGLADEVAAPAKGKTKDAATPRVFNLSKYKNVPEWVVTEPVTDVGKVLSKNNLEQLHTGMAAMQKVHDAACDTEDCVMSAKTRVTVKNVKKNIKNHGDGYGVEEQTHLAGPCAVACLHEELTDLIQDWLEDGYITTDEFLAASALITATVTAVSQGFEKIGIADREIPDWDEDEDDDTPDMVHTVTESHSYNSLTEAITALGELIADEDWDAWTVITDKLNIADKVISYADHGVATGTWKGPSLSDFTSSSWDDLDAAEKTRIAAHYTSQDGDAFADLHLPHHRAGKTGVGPAIKAGVDAAEARLDQTQTSTSDAAMKAHLDKHQAQFKEPDETKDEGDTLMVAADFTKLFAQVFDEVDDAAECASCDGTGKIKNGTVTCPDCGGSGKAEE